MPLCKVCNHPDLDDINQDRMSGVPGRVLSAKYGLSHQLLYRHYKDHVIASDSPQGLVYLGLEDVVNIPLQMRERRMLIEMLLDKALEPLSRVGKYSGLKYVNTNFLLGLLKIQAQDEQTILKTMGLLRPEVATGDMTDHQFGELRGLIEGRLGELAEGGGVIAGEARLVLANLLSPPDERLKSIERSIDAETTGA